MTPEEAFAIKPEFKTEYTLESIFCPEHRRLRDTLFNKTNVRFVHYTGAEAARQIIKTKRMWLRNTTAMIDHREIRHGFDLLISFFGEDNNKARFLEALDSVHVGAATEAIDLFDKYWINLDRGIQFQTFVACLSEHKEVEDVYGRLSMWRSFGSTAQARVALVVNLPPITDAMTYLNCFFAPVVYMEFEQLRQTLENIISKVKSEVAFLKTVDRKEYLIWIFRSLLMLVTCVKHKGFEEEREWRIVYLPGFLAEGHPSRLESKIVSINGIPQRIFEFPIDKKVASELSDIDLAAIFERMIVGPSSYPWVIYEAFSQELEQYGVNDAKAKVHISQIPLRNL